MQECNISYRALSDLLTQIMQCLSITIQNPFEFGHPVNSWQAVLVSSASRMGGIE